VSVKKIARSALVEHSAAEIYALVEDIESYPRFLPWCLEARVLERNPGSTKATLVIGMAGLRQSFTTRNENRPAEAIEMRLVEGPFKRFSAAWRFSPLAGRACRIDFSLEHEFSSRTLAKLLEPLFDRIANGMVDAFVRRADQVYGRSKAVDES
jgi:ribosome-associated toxin RatA of RatAB toxin-antitoxin module